MSKTEIMHITHHWYIDICIYYVHSLGIAHASPDSHILFLLVISERQLQLYIKILVWWCSRFPCIWGKHMARWNAMELGLLSIVFATLLSLSAHTLSCTWCTWPMTWRRAEYIPGRRWRWSWCPPLRWEPRPVSSSQTSQWEWSQRSGKTQWTSSYRRANTTSGILCISAMNVGLCIQRYKHIATFSN